MEEAAAGESSLAYFRQAKINWRQFEGQKLTIGLNKHPYTESLLPLIPEFEALTGIKVDYLILPENEYGAKLTADLSNQRGEFTVIMAGAMRNWAYVPPGWMVPLDQFLNDPKLTDPAWYKLEDFFPSLIAANRWNGKVAGGTGEGPLWSIPVMSESYVLAYRKDIFDQYKIKVPRTYEEMAEAARLVKKNAGIDGIVARGTPNFPTHRHRLPQRRQVVHRREVGRTGREDERPVPRSAGRQVQPDVDRHAPRERPGQLGQHDLVRRHGDVRRRPGRDVPGLRLLCRHLRGSQEVQGGRKGRLRPAAPGPAGTTYSGLFTWALGMSKATKNKEAAWLFIQWATSPRTLLNATVEFKNYNPTRVSVMNDPRTQKVMGGWGNGQLPEDGPGESQDRAHRLGARIRSAPGWGISGRGPCTRCTSSG